MIEEANAASVAILDGERVLVIQRARAPYQYLWTLPGGRRDEGENAEQCATREVREEMALALSDLALIEVQNLGKWQLAVFTTRSFAGDIVADAEEIKEYRWVTLAELADLHTTSQLDQLLQRAFAILP